MAAAMHQAIPPTVMKWCASLCGTRPPAVASPTATFSSAAWVGASVFGSDAPSSSAQPVPRGDGLSPAMDLPPRVP